MTSRQRKPDVPAPNTAGLTIVAAEPPAETGEDNPFIVPLKGSWDARDKETQQGPSQSFQCAPDQLDAYSKMIREAADFISRKTGERVGSAIRSYPTDDPNVIRVFFRAKKRREMKGAVAATAPVSA